MKELMYIRSFSKRRLPVIVGTLLLVIIGSVWLNTAPFRSGFDIADELGGNIFPSSILSVATTDAQVIVPVDSMYVGNPKSCIAVRVRSRNAYSRVRVEVAETPFFPVQCRSLCWQNRVRSILSILISYGIMRL